MVTSLILLVQKLKNYAYNIHGNHYFRSELIVVLLIYVGTLPISLLNNFPIVPSSSLKKNTCCVTIILI